MAVEQLTSGNDDGSTVGASSTEKIALHGATPIAQATLATIATGATISTAVTKIQEIVAALANKGITSLT